MGLSEFLPEEIRALEVTTGDDLIQDHYVERTEGDSDYAYPLTAFIPKCDSDGGDIPAKAARWIIPDIEDFAVVRQVKLWELPFYDGKIPPGLDQLYIRTNRFGYTDPTPLQQAVWDVAPTFYRDGKQERAAQMRLLPVLAWRGEEKVWKPALAEVPDTAWRAITKEVSRSAKYTGGKMNPASTPLAVWRVNGKRGEVGVDFDVDMGVDGRALLKEHEMLDPVEYVKTRAIHTETWLKEQLERSHGLGPIADTVEAVKESQDDLDSYLDSVRALKADTLKGILREREYDNDSIPRTKRELIALFTAERKQLEKDVQLAIAAAGEED